MVLNSTFVCHCRKYNSHVYFSTIGQIFIIITWTFFSYLELISEVKDGDGAIAIIEKLGPVIYLAASRLSDDISQFSVTIT